MEPFIGQIIMFGGNFAPRNWALCDGSLLSISENQALFSILGTIYGGDGRTTFALPDLRGRVAMHAGSGPGLSNRPLGQKGGTEENFLTINQLPSHNHTVSASGTVNPRVFNGAGSETNPGGAYHATATGDVFSETSNTEMAPSPLSLSVGLGNTGGNASVNNIQPFQCVNYIIALLGTFPSRN